MTDNQTVTQGYILGSVIGHWRIQILNDRLFCHPAGQVTYWFYNRLVNICENVFVCFNKTAHIVKFSETNAEIKLPGISLSIQYKRFQSNFFFIIDTLFFRFNFFLVGNAFPKKHRKENGQISVMQCFGFTNPSSLHVAEVVCAWAEMANMCLILIVVQSTKHGS